MTKQIFAAIAGVVVGLVIAAALAHGGGSLGGVYTQVSNTFRDGIKVGTTNQYTISKTGVVSTTGAGTFGGLTVTTTDTATSSTAVGCVQTTATSTATAIRLVFSNIATSSPTYRGTNTVGLVGWQYGSCP